LVIVEGISFHQTGFKNFIRLAGRRSSDEVQQLRRYLLRQRSNTVVELGGAADDALDIELGLGLGEPHFSRIRPKRR